MRVHPRVHERHPEISDEDVRHAWEAYELRATRDRADREMRVGFDLRGRALEMVGVLQGGDWLVFHAMTPPSKKTLRETRMARRRG